MGLGLASEPFPTIDYTVCTLGLLLAELLHGSQHHVILSNVISSSFHCIICITSKTELSFGDEMMPGNSIARASCQNMHADGAKPIENCMSS